MSLFAPLLAAFLAGLGPPEHNHRVRPSHRPHRAHRRPQGHPRPMATALASWYDDAGTTASGVHYTYGYASLMFGSRWGYPVRFCYRRCVIGRLDDHGPYVGGRAFDLNANLRGALGCPDLCVVRWRRPMTGAKLTLVRKGSA